MTTTHSENISIRQRRPRTFNGFLRATQQEGCLDVRITPAVALVINTHEDGSIKDSHFRHEIEYQGIAPNVRVKYTEPVAFVPGIIDARPGMRDLTFTRTDLTGLDRLLLVQSRLKGPSVTLVNPHSGPFTSEKILSLQQRAESLGLTPWETPFRI